MSLTGRLGREASRLGNFLLGSSGEAGAPGEPPEIELPTKAVAAAYHATATVKPYEAKATVT